MQGKATGGNEAENTQRKKKARIGASMRLPYATGTQQLMPQAGT
jgi:hypothetical protein